MDTKVQKRYEICLECIKERLPKRKNVWDKNTAIVSNITTLLKGRKANKWYNPVNNSVDLCKPCDFAGQHRLYIVRDDSVVYLKY